VLIAANPRQDGRLDPPAVERWLTILSHIRAGGTSDAGGAARASQPDPSGSTREPSRAMIVTVSAMSAQNGETAKPVPLAGTSDVPNALTEEIRDPSFSSSIRGYDRHDVNRYVERVNQLIAELQISVSARAAVRHALERVGEQTSAILQRARDTAEEITSSAREEADETIARANAEAGDIVARAEREAGEVAAHARAEAEQTVTAARTDARQLLERAHKDAESTLARARDDAAARVRQAEEEIGSLREQADSTMQSLQVQIEAVAEQRRAGLEEIREIAMRLQQLLADAGPSEGPEAVDSSERAGESPEAPPDS
jgi:cell division septum initiation protein DivIVA